MNRIAAVCAAMLLLWSGSAWSQDTRIDIVARGVYTADRVSIEHKKSGVDHSTLTNIRLAVDTADIPMQLGVHFGFQFVVHGTAADQTVRLRQVTVFPPAGLVPAATQKRVHGTESVMAVKLGAIAYAGYHLSDTWELAPGLWVIQLWDGDRKLAEQQFNVRSP